LLLIPFLLAPQLGAWLGEWALTAGIFLGLTAFALSNNWALAGWMPLLRHNIPEGRRAELVGRVNQISSRASFVILLLLILSVMQKETAVWRFQLIFVVGAALVSLRAVFSRSLEDVNNESATDGQQFWHDISGIWKDVPFRRLLTYTSLCFFAMGLVVPFRPLYLKSLGFSDRFVMLATVPLIPITYSITIRGWGRLADRFGSRGVYGLGGAGTILGLFIFLSAQGGTVWGAAAVILGLAIFVMSWGGIDSGNTFRLFTIVPQKNQSLYMAFNTIAIICTMALGSFTSGAAIKILRLLLPQQTDIPGLDFRIVFMLAAALMALATLYSRRMRELHEISTPGLILHLRLRTQRRMSLGISAAFTRFRKKPSA